MKSILNLHSLFSYQEFDRAFNKLKKKNKYRQNYLSPNVRDRYIEKQVHNALGKFLDKYSNNKTPLYDGLTRYQLEPYTGTATVKKNGDYRPLLIPSPLDRLVFLMAHPRIMRVISARLLKFSALGVGIKGKESLKVPNISYKILQEIKDKKIKYVLALDFKNFFSTISRDKLFNKLKNVFYKSGEKELLALLVLSINNKIKGDKLFKLKFLSWNLDKVGIPQGLAYSPLLASFFATCLDLLIKKTKGVTSYRYLDDIIIIGRNKKILKEIYEEIKDFSLPLGLQLHPLGGKTKILPVIKLTDSFDFLGISFSKSGKHIPKSATEKFLNTIKSEILTKKGLGTSQEKVRTRFREYVVGWSQSYLSTCPDDYYEIKPILAKEIKSYMFRKREWKKIYFSNERLFSLNF